MPGQNTYWWVQTDANDDTGTSVFITVRKDGSLQEVRRPLKRVIYGDKDQYAEDAKLRRAFARWVWSLDDEKAVGKCGSGSCS